MLKTDLTNLHLFWSLNMYSFALFAWLFAGPQRCARGFPWLAVEGFAACRNQRRSQQSSPGASAAFPVAAAPPGRWHRARALAAGQPASARAAAAAGPCPRRPAGKPASLTNGGEKRAALAPLCQHNPPCLPPQSKQKTNWRAPAEDGKAIHHLEFFIQSLKIQNPQYCCPHMCGLSPGCAAEHQGSYICDFRKGMFAFFRWFSWLSVVLAIICKIGHAVLPVIHVSCGSEPRQ